MMEKIITEADLRFAILQLEGKQTQERILMKEQFLITVETLKPINLIKSTLLEAAESEDLQDNFLNAALGLSAGYLSKMMFQGKSGGPVKKILGTALMFGVKSLIAQNPEAIKKWGGIFFAVVRNLLREKDTRKSGNTISGETADQ
jgi:hypothetical protein